MFKIRILQKASNFMIGSLESVFYRWGKFVSLHPFPIILTCLLATALSGVGFLRFRMEYQANLLWIPKDSPYNLNEVWLLDNFQRNKREQVMLYTADNVLTPKALQEMYEIHQTVANIEVEGKRFSDICFKIPISDIFHSKRRRRRQAALEGDSVVIGSSNAIADRTADSDSLSTTVLASFSSSPASSATSDLSTTAGSSSSTTAGSSVSVAIGTTTPAAHVDDGWSEDLWADYDYDSEKKEEADRVAAKIRIDFNKYGPRLEGQKRVDTSQGENLPDDIYCDLINNLKDLCLQSSLLDIWKYDRELIYTATQEEIVFAVNTLVKSPWLSYPVNYTQDLLGGKTYNSTGHVIGATSVRLVWFVAPAENLTEVDAEVGLELEQADPLTKDWETAFLAAAFNASVSPGARVYVNAGRSFGDVSAEAVFFNIPLMLVGYLLMFVYTMLTLGKISKVEIRVYLSMVGISSIAMALVISVGITSALGYPYTPMHAALPFLALGIGIDDMFVIVQCFMNLEKDGSIKGLPLHEAMGQTLKHAGVAVTITSCTDVFAFAIGSITKMPGIEAFCVATALALLSIYLLMITWFTAFMSLDQQRMAANRNGIFPCFVHKSKNNNNNNQQQPAIDNNSTQQHPVWKQVTYMFRNMEKVILSVYEWLLPRWVFKAAVLTATGAFLAIGVWGTAVIRQEFDPILLLPPSSYLRQFADRYAIEFPINGWSAEVYSGQFDHTDLATMEAITTGLQGLVDNQTHLLSIDPWWEPLKRYAARKRNLTNWQEFANAVDFPEVLSDFLYSSEGAAYKANFKWANGSLACREAAPPIAATKFGITYRLMSGPEEHIPAKRAVEGIIRTATAATGDRAFSHVKVYAAWETDEIIGYELLRNVGLGMMCVMVVTMILLVSLQLSTYVFVCVIATLVDLVGFLHFWGMTIDIISSINIDLAIGLCVDYVVHIGHAYMVTSGTRDQKAYKAVEDIGPAVLQGGFSTFLALLPLAFTESYLFQAFFKVFLLTVVFGLWHGLFVMPVLLSIIGPLNGSGGHEAAAPPLDTATAPPLSAEAKAAISTLGGTLTARPSLTIKNSFVFDREVRPGGFVVRKLKSALGSRASWRLDHA